MAKIIEQKGFRTWIPTKMDFLSSPVFRNFYNNLYMENKIELQVFKTSEWHNFFFKACIYLTFWQLQKEKMATLNQCVAQVGPKQSPSEASVNGCVMISSKV